MAIELSKALGAAPLAEGVETIDQAKILVKHGCLFGQGYLWGRPMPENDFAAWWSRTTSGGNIVAA